MARLDAFWKNDRKTKGFCMVIEVTGTILAVNRARSLENKLKYS